MPDEGGGGGETTKQQKDKQFQRADRISGRTTVMELLKRFNESKADMILISRFLTPFAWEAMLRQEEGSALCTEATISACVKCQKKCRGFYEQLFAIMLANASINTSVDYTRSLKGVEQTHKYENLAETINKLRKTVNRCVAKPFLQYTMDPSFLQEQIADVANAYDDAVGIQLGFDLATYISFVIDGFGSTIPVADRAWIYPDDGKRKGGKFDLGALNKMLKGGGK